MSFVQSVVVVLLADASLCGAALLDLCRCGVSFAVTFGIVIVGTKTPQYQMFLRVCSCLMP